MILERAQASSWVDLSTTRSALIHSIRKLPFRQNEMNCRMYFRSSSLNPGGFFSPVALFAAPARPPIALDSEQRRLNAFPAMTLHAAVYFFLTVVFRELRNVSRAAARFLASRA
jgi:hypothetical protein